MKNNRIIYLGYALKGLAIVLVALSMAILLSSCGKAAEKAAVAVVIDKGANSQLADGAAECLEQACADVLRGGGHLTIICASSHPQIICDKDVKAPGNSSKTALESRWKKDAAFAEARSDSWTPNAEEIDLIKSIKLAADSLRTADPECTTRTIYIAAPGLSSAGLLDFTGGRYGNPLSWDYPELVKRMMEDTSSGVIEAEGLPDLTDADIHVVWMGFGQITAGSQAELTPDHVAQLKDLWTTVLQACGAEFDPKSDFINCPVSDVATDHSNLPKVTPVVFEDSVSLVSLDENVLAFNPNEATFREGDAYARTILAPYAESLAKSKQKIVVLGTTAKENGAELNARILGEKRAQRVKGMLCELGNLDESQITVASAGFEGVDVKIGNSGKTVSFYTDNYNPDGSWNEEIARTNRSVALIDYDLADDIIARFSI